MLYHMSSSQVLVLYVHVCHVIYHISPSQVKTHIICHILWYTNIIYVWSSSKLMWWYLERQTRNMFQNQNKDTKQHPLRVFILDLILFNWWFQTIAHWLAKWTYGQIKLIMTNTLPLQNWKNASTDDIKEGGTAI